MGARLISKPNVSLGPGHYSPKRADLITKPRAVGVSFGRV